MNVIERHRKTYKIRREGDFDNFKAMYRFSEQNVEWLAEHFLGPDTGERRGGALTNSQKMRTFLRYVGDPGFQVEKYFICIFHNINLHCDFRFDRLVSERISAYTKQQPTKSFGMSAEKSLLEVANGFVFHPVSKI